MSELTMDVITSLVAVVVGFGLGQIVAWRKATIGGRPFLVPTAHPSPRSAKIAALLVILVAVSSMVSGVVTQHRLEECNEDFRETLRLRSAGTTEQFEAITDLQERLADAEPGVEGSQERYNARLDYVDRVEKIAASRAANPYPDVEC